MNVGYTLSYDEYNRVPAAYSIIKGTSARIKYMLV